MTTTQHPLTEADAVELWDGHVPRVLNFRVWTWGDRRGILTALRAAFDAGREHEREHAFQDRPWEPLNGGRVYVGDEVRRDRGGLTVTAVVGRVDADGNPWTAEGTPIGDLGYGTWYVRRTAPELPAGNEAVIERADGHKYITATVSGETYRAREAILSGERWLAVWRRDPGREAISFVRSNEITPGTWKVEGE